MTDQAQKPRIQEWKLAPCLYIPTQIVDGLTRSFEEKELDGTDLCPIAQCPPTFEVNYQQHDN
jgi:hypothetical protein